MCTAQKTGEVEQMPTTTSDINPSMHGVKKKLARHLANKPVNKLQITQIPDVVFQVWPKETFFEKITNKFINPDRKNLKKSFPNKMWQELS